MKPAFSYVRITRDQLSPFTMFTRSLRARHVPHRCATRKDIGFHIRGVSEPRVFENERVVSMQPHPYSPGANSLETSSPPSSSGSVPPPSPASSSRPTTSSEKPDANSTHLTVIMSPNRINTNAPNIDNQPPSRLSNPFDTHKMFKQLENDFPSPIAHTLMRAVRGLLMDRIAKARREGLDVKEAENVSISSHIIM